MTLWRLPSPSEMTLSLQSLEFPPRHKREAEPKACLNGLRKGYRDEADPRQVQQEACFVSALYLLPFKQAARQSFILPAWRLSRPVFAEQT